MSTTVEYPRVLIIAVWFGPLPELLPFWLTSCRYNPRLEWLLLTDASPTGIDLPPNVRMVNISQAEFIERISSFAGAPVTMPHPYKACDFRPLYSCLLDLVPEPWDFWGHCDLDMLFGDVTSFLTADVLARNDRVFGLGHLSVYRNDEPTNNFFRLEHPTMKYRDVLSDPTNRGFDEHLGVNLTWRLHGGRFHEDESIVADIDPLITGLQRTSTLGTASNARTQAFGFDRGRVFRAFARGRQIHTEDFMYVHFQKRTFHLPAPPAECEAVWLTPAGLVAMDESPLTVGHLRGLNPRPSWQHPREVAQAARRRMRLLRRRLGRVYK